ncbi:MAG TPA: hypothetical protein VGR45_03360 [Stellaceae bacterium]|nr:hypothetical protein [Stellaceae bacterium]
MFPHHLVVIDGSEFLFRAYYAFPPLLRSDGAPIGAVYGFTTILSRLLATIRTDHVAIAFDAPGPSFRHLLYRGYKAQRPTAPPDLIAQFVLVRRATMAFSLHPMELAGFEADDLIATYSRHAVEEGAEVTIVSSDKDLM